MAQTNNTRNTNDQAENEFMRKIADQIWQKIKGKPLPATYTANDVEGVWRRYWHKVMESEQ